MSQLSAGVPITAIRGHSHLQSLAAFHQHGMEVQAFAQKFWTRVDCQGAEIKDIFNISLDKPLLQWVMDWVKFLDQILADSSRGESNTQCWG